MVPVLRMWLPYCPVYGLVFIPTSILNSATALYSIQDRFDDYRPLRLLAYSGYKAVIKNESSRCFENRGPMKQGGLIWKCCACFSVPRCALFLWWLSPKENSFLE
ncbi:hypothetical protein CEXT_53601 [Caerostris extrusa]|uniref:Reverse transcriptase zinc-binding domain-containing protein n=1 Tax=Caerostris extrusa TaxID=172846 RepID=A0AAV4M8V9_CAEEX|nr:hypothetical protein CEXT_53601 [Caerostris extrusa]